MPDDRGGLLPIFLNARDLPILIVGGGRVGCRRANTLAAAGASRVTVVTKSPPAEPTPGARVVVEAFRPDHLDGQRLAFAATDSAAVNELVQRAAAERNVLCCRADAADLGDFVTPAVVAQGGVTAAVAAGSPVLTRRLRMDLQDVAARWGDLAAVNRQWRPTLLACGDQDAAHAALRDLASDEARAVLHQHGPAALVAWLAPRHPTLDLSALG